MLTLFYFELNTELKETTPQIKNFAASIHPERCISMIPVINNAVFGTFATKIIRAKLINNPIKGIYKGIFINFPIAYDFRI